MTEAASSFRYPWKALALSATLHVLALSLISVGSAERSAVSSPARLDVTLQSSEASVVAPPLLPDLKTSNIDPASPLPSDQGPTPSQTENSGLLPDIAKTHKPRLLTPLELDAPEIQSVARAIRLQFTLFITVTGEVKRVTLDYASEDSGEAEELVRLLLTKLSTARFKPAEEGGVSVPSSTTIEILIEENNGSSSLAR